MFKSRKKVLSHLSQLNVGIAFPQETHLRICDQSILRGAWIGQLFHSNFNNKSRGMAKDLNSTFSPLDRSSPRRIPQTRAETIELFLQTCGVTDVWCFQNPTSRCYSLFSHVHKTFSRIDYF